MRDLTDDIQPTQYNGFCQNCAEKDQRIKELEQDCKIYRGLSKNYAQQLKNLRQEKYPVDFDCFKKLKIEDERDRKWYLKGFNNCEKQISSNFADIQKELALYKKALELACDYTESEWGNEYCPDYDDFLQQAKECIDHVGEKDTEMD